MNFAMRIHLSSLPIRKRVTVNLFVFLRSIDPPYVEPSSCVCTLELRSSRCWVGNRYGPY